MSGKPDAWAAYWREAAAAGSGCAPDAPGIAAATAQIWREFADALPDQAQMLDLATGSGAVLRHVRSVKPNAGLVGVDSAPDLGSPRDPGIRLMPAVEMEKLPFEANSLDAVTSQFGFEYGRTADVAVEVAKVLRSGGKVRLVIHHEASPVVQQGAVRAGQLRWALKSGSALEQAQAFARARMSQPLPIPPDLRAAPEQATRAFHGYSVATEIMTGMLQMLELGGGNTPRLLEQLRARVSDELARLDALQTAACSESDIARIVDELGRADLLAKPPQPVHELPSGPLFAWLVDASRD